MKWIHRKTNLSFEERRVSAEGSGQYVIIDLITKITAEDPEIIWKQGRGTGFTQA